MKKKVAREKNQFCARENEFRAREKNEKKSKKCPWKKKVGVKNLKNGPKSGRENEKVPVKKPKKRPKIAFTGTFYFHNEKKNTLACYVKGGSP